MTHKKIKTLAVFLFGVFIFVDVFAMPIQEITKLKYSPTCILKAAAKIKGIQLRKEIPLPKLHLASETSLKEFQDAVEPQWNMRPESIVNSYVEKTNEIFLMDEASYYKKHNRTLDDSLAHEFTHYMQSKYQNMDLARDDTDQLESDAVDVQTIFRERYMQTGKSPCVD